MQPRSTSTPSFQSLRSLRTATLFSVPRKGSNGISILAVLADRDRWRAPAGPAGRYFNPRGPCGPRRHRPVAQVDGVAISILAVLADRDTKMRRMVVSLPLISILAVLADRDRFSILRLLPIPLFQSSRSLRTATANRHDTAELSWEFQSSRSLRTATALSKRLSDRLSISILAVLADRDPSRPPPGPPPCHFNPRGPCGPRPHVDDSRASEEISILAVLADRDLPLMVEHDAGEISILAVLADRDIALISIALPPYHFNPRGPCGPRRGLPGCLGRPHGISILAVLADRDSSPWRLPQPPPIFQSSRSLRTATHGIVGGRRGAGISILAVLADRDQLTASASVSNSGISILAVLADRDMPYRRPVGVGEEISILAVLADRDPAGSRSQ